MINAGIAKSQREDWMHTVLRQVHLPGAADVFGKFTHQMSGGQLQRIVLTGALILEPNFIVADASVSMLDVSVSAGILNVMRDVRDAMDLAAIYISHGVTLVRYVCACTLVMYRGRIVEDGPTANVVRAPRHPYTQALISAVPLPRMQQNRELILIKPLAQRNGRSVRWLRVPRPLPACVPTLHLGTPVLRVGTPAHLAACHLHRF